MAIAPITSVSFKNNYDQINFEGKKGNHGNNSGLTPMKKLAVPLAATVLAMTPSNVSAKYNMDAEPVTTEVMANDTVAYKYLDYEGYDRSYPDKKIRIFFLDTDGNLNNESEALMVQRNENTTYTRPVRGADGKFVILPDGSTKRALTIKKIESTMIIDTLKHEVRTNIHADGKKSTEDFYYIKGPTRNIVKEVDKASARIIKNKTSNFIGELEISEKFYNDLVDTLKDKVAYKTVRTTKNLEEIDELDILYKIGSSLGM